MAIARNDPGLAEEFFNTLRDFVDADNLGSAYCIRNYCVDAALGGNEGLAHARRELRLRGLRLVLDFVPNHCAQDHPWVGEHPEYFIQASLQDFASDPSSFFRTGKHILARGRDPNSPAWPDAAQLNIFSRGLRDALIETLRDIARQCDGLRCDMAMLVLNNVFERTWGDYAGNRIKEEFWTEAISVVRMDWPYFMFIAECYWCTEWELQQQGFNYCYDKRLYDRLVHENAETIRAHLASDVSYQDRLIRFIENHDEPRAALTFEDKQGRAAAIISASLPGAKLFHEGQFEGRRVRLPVFLRRRPDEIEDQDKARFYEQLLRLISDPAIREGEWMSLDCGGWPNNPSFNNLLAWGYRLNTEYRLIVANYSAADAHGFIKLPWAALRDRKIRLYDELHQYSYSRIGNELLGEGLFIDLPDWGAHWFSFRIPEDTRRDTIA